MAPASARLARGWTFAVVGALVMGALGSRPAVVAQNAAAPVLEAQLDRVFSAWTPATPGCAVGVALGGRSVAERAYGMADLEHDAPNRLDTIIEAGSVSKQFTAAAVLLLAEDGRLSLDDPVRKHVPELPDYGAPLTIRHLLTHTSGLRDWGSLAAIAGWPRGERVHTHAHVVDILSRQRALNFTSGTRWSYSNSGYNLAAVIVARVSGRSFAEFSRQRIFEPLGLTRTSWRDDHTRLIKGRANAYSGGRGGFSLDMPFEDVHGNGGLLTTVGDLLRWSEVFASPTGAWAGIVREQQRPATLSGGQALHYGLGLFVGRYKGVNEIYHSGSTAGYRAFLTRFPDAGLSVAVLCNAGTANATALAHAVADLYLGARVVAGAAPVRPPAEALGPLAGIAADASWQPAAADLREFEGDYSSADVETSLSIGREDAGLVITGRAGRRIVLRPHSRDRFDAPGLGLLTFHRTGGRVAEFGVTQDRVWDLRFVRVTPPGLSGPAVLR